MKIPDNIPVNWKTFCTGLLMFATTGFIGDFLSPWTIKAEVEKLTKNDKKQDEELSELKTMTKILTYGVCLNVKDDDPMKEDCKKILTNN